MVGFGFVVWEAGGKSRASDGDETVVMHTRTHGRRALVPNQNPLKRNESMETN